VSSQNERLTTKRPASRKQSSLAHLSPHIYNTPLSAAVLLNLVLSLHTGHASLNRLALYSRAALSLPLPMPATPSTHLPMLVEGTIIPHPNPAMSAQYRGRRYGVRLRMHGCWGFIPSISKFMVVCWIGGLSTWRFTDYLVQAIETMSNSDSLFVLMRTKSSMFATGISEGAKGVMEVEVI
jgi:hypothetical protein